MSDEPEEQPQDESLMGVLAQVYTLVAEHGWEEVLRMFGFNPAHVQEAMAAGERRQQDRGTMLCIGLVAGVLYEQGIRAMTEGVDDGS